MTSQIGLQSVFCVTRIGTNNDIKQTQQFNHTFNAIVLMKEKRGVEKILVKQHACLDCSAFLHMNYTRLREEECVLLSAIMATVGSVCMFI